MVLVGSEVEYMYNNAPSNCNHDNDDDNDGDDDDTLVAQSNSIFCALTRSLVDTHTHTHTHTHSLSRTDPATMSVAMMKISMETARRDHDTKSGQVGYPPSFSVSIHAVLLSGERHSQAHSTQGDTHSSCEGVVGWEEVLDTWYACGGLPGSSRCHVFQNQPPTAQHERTSRRQYRYTLTAHNHQPACINFVLVFFPLLLPRTHALTHSRTDAHALLLNSSRKRGHSSKKKQQSDRGLRPSCTNFTSHTTRSSRRATARSQH